MVQDTWSSRTSVASLLSLNVFTDRLTDDVKAMCIKYTSKFVKDVDKMAEIKCILQSLLKIHIKLEKKESLLSVEKVVSRYGDQLNKFYTIFIQRKTENRKCGYF